MVIDRAGIRGWFLVGLALAVLAAGASAQQVAPPKSVDVHTDGSITFRFVDPNAKAVGLSLDGVAQPMPMQRDAAAVWSMTTVPLAPEVYGYAFVVDGQPRLDPQSHAVRPNLAFFSDAVSVPSKPGTPPLPWEATSVPHGVVHHHVFESTIVKGLPGNRSEFYVYTPPGYDAKADKLYPVLYLLHGWSDLALGWSEVGLEPNIMDNLIAQGKARPMVVVMPLGYGDMSFVRQGFGIWQQDAPIRENTKLFSESLLTEVLPRVEAAYNVSKKAEDRAIAGLSMGGLEGLTIGLNHPEEFDWVGGFSAAVHRLDHSLDVPNVDEKTSAQRRLLWIACGTEDSLIKPNRALVAWLKTKDVPVTAVETPGMHTWMVWRDNLIHFAPLLFQPK